MYPKIISLYGPFELNSYNTAIMLGIALFFFFANRHPLRALLMTSNEFMQICTEGALIGILGARLLHVLTSLDYYQDLISILSIWDGGLSILGALIAVISYAFWRLQKGGITFLTFGDLVCLYLPIIHATGRVGCFLVGCCYGAKTSLPWAVTYIDPQVFAPLHCPVHPSQLYSAILFVVLFAGLWWYAQGSWKTRGYRPAGMITCLYLMGMSFERWVIDFFRGDRSMITGSALSVYQWISLAIFVGATITLLRIRSKPVGAHEPF